MLPNEQSLASTRVTVKSHHHDRGCETAEGELCAVT